MAGEFELPLIQLAATELVSGVSGDTEEKIRQLFEIAKQNAPCVLVCIVFFIAKMFVDVVTTTSGIG